MIKLRGYGRSIITGKDIVVPTPAGSPTSWPGQNVAYIMPGEGTLVSKGRGVIETSPSPISKRGGTYIVRESRPSTATGRSFVRADVVTMGEKPLIQTPSDMSISMAEEPTSAITPDSELAQDLPTTETAYATEGEVSASDIADTGIDIGQEEFGVEKKTNWLLWGGLIAAGVAVAGTVGYLAYKESKKRKKGKKS